MGGANVDAENFQLWAKFTTFEKGREALKDAGNRKEKLVPPLHYQL